MLDSSKWSKALVNEHLTDEERIYEAQFGLMVSSAWRLSFGGSIVGGWTESGQAPLDEKLRCLIGK